MIKDSLPPLLRLRFHCPCSGGHGSPVQWRKDGHRLLGDRLGDSKNSRSQGVGAPYWVEAPHSDTADPHSGGVSGGEGEGDQTSQGAVVAHSIL